MLTKKEIKELPKGFHPSNSGLNRFQKRRDSEKEKHNNRGMIRVRIITFGKNKQQKKVLEYRQQIGRKVIYHYW